MNPAVSVNWIQIRMDRHSVLMVDSAERSTGKYGLPTRGHGFLRFYGLISLICLAVLIVSRDASVQQVSMGLFASSAMMKRMMTMRSVVYGAITEENVVME
jgi:hypothetical protein